MGGRGKNDQGKKEFNSESRILGKNKQTNHTTTMAATEQMMLREIAPTSVYNSLVGRVAPLVLDVRTIQGKSEG